MEASLQYVDAKLCMCMCATLVFIQYPILYFSWLKKTIPSCCITEMPTFQSSAILRHFVAWYLSKDIRKYLWNASHTRISWNSRLYPTDQSLFCCCVVYACSFSHITIILSLVLLFFFNIHLWHSSISILYGERIRLMCVRVTWCVCVCVCVLYVCIHIMFWCNKCKYMSNEHTYAYDMRAGTCLQPCKQKNETKWNETMNRPKNEQQHHFILSHNDCGNGNWNSLSTSCKHTQMIDDLFFSSHPSLLYSLHFHSLTMAWMNLLQMIVHFSHLAGISLCRPLCVHHQIQYHSHMQ